MIGVPWCRRIVVVQSHDTKGWVLHHPWEIPGKFTVETHIFHGKIMDNPMVSGVSGFDVRFSLEPIQ